MGTHSAGEKFDLKNDVNILRINSPLCKNGRGITRGPFIVVYKDVPSRFAIVAFEYNNDPRLGIRHFWDSSGYPNRGKTATWLVIPPEMNYFVIHFVTRSWRIIKWFNRSRILKSFLSKKITPEQLKKIWH